MTHVSTASASTDVAARLVELEETERHLLSGALHDGPVQVVVGLRLLADLAAAALARGDLEAAGRLLGELTAATREAQGSLRDTMRGLHGRCLDGTGLAEALEVHAAALTVPVSVDVRVGQLPVATAVAVHRIVRAALGDLQTQGCLGVWIGVVPADEGVECSVSATLPESEQRLSVDPDLAVWADRVRLLGGRFACTSDPTDPSANPVAQRTVTCWLPLVTPALGGPRS